MPIIDTTTAAVPAATVPDTTAGTIDNEEPIIEEPITIDYAEILKLHDMRFDTIDQKHKAIIKSVYEDIYSNYTEATPYTELLVDHDKLVNCVEKYELGIYDNIRLLWLYCKTTECFQDIEHNEKHKLKKQACYLIEYISEKLDSQNSVLEMAGITYTSLGSTSLSTALMGHL
jgi:hypothetical protein